LLYFAARGGDVKSAWRLHGAISWAEADRSPPTTDNNTPDTRMATVHDRQSPGAQKSRPKNGISTRSAGTGRESLSEEMVGDAMTFRVTANSRLLEHESSRLSTVIAFANGHRGKMFSGVTRCGVVCLEANYA